jgi:TPP-dependent trihydroxycyclohexane-1,2-dione (THcHDO) dehydratase
MALQKHEGDKPFFISARVAGDLAGVHYTDASKMLAAFVTDGVLELVKKGAGKVASRYRFIWRQP